MALPALAHHTLLTIPILQMSFRLSAHACLYMYNILIHEKIHETVPQELFKYFIANYSDQKHKQYKSRRKK